MFRDLFCKTFVKINCLRTDLAYLFRGVNKRLGRTSLEFRKIPSPLAGGTFFLHFALDPLYVALVSRQNPPLRGLAETVV